MAEAIDSKLRAGTVVAVLVTAFVALVFAPSSRKLAQARADLDVLGDAVRTRSAEIAGLPGFAAEIAAAERAAVDVYSAFPSGDPVGAFLEQVAAVSSKLGLQVAEEEPLPAVTDGRVAFTPIRLAVAGPYVAVHTFVRELEESPRVLRVTALRLHDRAVQPGTADDRTVIEGELWVRVFSRPKPG